MVSFPEHSSASSGPPASAASAASALRATASRPAASAPHASSAPHSPPDVWSLPTEQLDELDTLREEIITVSARLEADTQKLLTLIAEYDARGGWELCGYRGCAEWLAAATGIDIGAARERVRTARALAGLPLLSEAMGRGELSFSKVRALTRIAQPDNEEGLLEIARESSAAQLERVVRTWKRGDEDELEREERRFASRELLLFPDLDGMIQVRGRLTPEQGALLMKAIEAASDGLFRAEWSTREASQALILERERRRMAAQRRADALVFLAERAMEAGVGGGATEGECEADSSSPVHSGTQAERYQVILHVGQETLAGSDRGSAREADSEASGARSPSPSHAHRSEIEPGIRVSAEMSRRLCCDASVVRVTHGQDARGGPDREGHGEDSILHVGRRTRTIPPALRRALEVRDRECRFPGCSSTFCEAHHIRHWADGGETSLSNTLLLCRHHHRLLHEGRWTLQLTASGHPRFTSPRGESWEDYRSSPIRLRGRQRGREPGQQPAKQARKELVRGGGIHGGAKSRVSVNGETIGPAGSDMKVRERTPEWAIGRRVGTGSETPGRHWQGNVR